MEYVEQDQRRKAVLRLSYPEITALQQGCSDQIELPGFGITIELEPVKNQPSRLEHRDGAGICWVNTKELSRLLLLREPINAYNAALVLQLEIRAKENIQLPDGLVEFAQPVDD